jgi:hypothetical protein
MSSGLSTIVEKTTVFQWNHFGTLLKVHLFNDKEKLKKFMTNKPAWQKVLKEILHTDEKDKCKQENMGKSKFH